jgi:hypothetical protein
MRWKNGCEWCVGKDLEGDGSVLFQTHLNRRILHHDNMVTITAHSIKKLLAKKQILVHEYHQNLRTRLS